MLLTATEPPPELLVNVFPWIEKERMALNVRSKLEGRHGQDNALSALLDLLVYFRRVLLQDAAVLSAMYPCFPIFKFSPCDSVLFQQFSASSLEIITRTEADIRHQLARLPEDVAATFKGLLTSSAMQDEEIRQSLKSTQNNMERNLQIAQDMQKAAYLKLNTTAKKRKAAEAFLSLPPSLYLVILSMTFLTDSLLVRPSPSPPTAAGSDATNAMAVPPNSHAEVTPSTSSTVTNGQVESALRPASPEQTISLSGNIYPFTTFPISSDPSFIEGQHNSIIELKSIFSYEKLLKHQFEWIQESSEWLPKFDSYFKPTKRELTIYDIWKENRFGINGQFSIQELTAQWGPRWRRNVGSLKTEAGRQNKVINLIEALSKKRNWTAELALQFLGDQYPIQKNSKLKHLKTARSFMDYLNQRTSQEILEASITYP